MTLSDIQPHYFPRLHYFARMFASSHFVVRDDVQFVKNHKFPDGSRGVSHQVHSPIKTNAGKHLLNVPVRKGGMPPICETLISYDQPWVTKHLNQLQAGYSRSPQFAAVHGEIESLLHREFRTVGELNVATLCWALVRMLTGSGKDAAESPSLDSVNALIREKRPGDLAAITTGTDVFGGGSEMPATEKIVHLCKRFGATNYLAGSTAFESYMDPGVFERAGIGIELQDWKCQQYPQQFAKVEEFIPNLSIIDLLMNCAPGKALELLLSGR